MGETFERRDMAGVVFHEVNMENAKFEDVNLSGANFKNVNFARATLKNVYLTGAIIPAADLSGLTIKGANIPGFTISGIRIDELFEAELDRRDPDRASLRIHDYFNPKEVREVMERLDQLRAKFCEMLRSKDANLLATRPEPEEWSAVEIVRHLVTAEDGYLNHHILKNDKPYIKLGLLPDHIVNDPEFADIGTEPTNDLETVLAAWESVHKDTQKYVAGVTADELKGKVNYAQGTIGSLLQLLAHHDLLHIRQAEAALATLEQAK